MQTCLARHEQGNPTEIPYICMLRLTVMEIKKQIPLPYQMGVVKSAFLTLCLSIVTMVVSIHTINCQLLIISFSKHPAPYHHVVPFSLSLQKLP